MAIIGMPQNEKGRRFRKNHGISGPSEPDEKSGLADDGEGTYQVLHSKFVVVDSQWAFVGSANFSDAAVEKNVELGLQVHSRMVARKILRDVQAFETQGVLVPVSPVMR